MTANFIDDLLVPVKVVKGGRPTVDEPMTRPTGPGALTAARRPVQIIEGIPDADLAAYELRAEAAMVQALQQVMDTIADRIAKAGPPS